MRSGCPRWDATSDSTARAEPAGVGEEELRAAAGEQGNAVAVDEGTRDGSGTADHGSVSALEAATAEIERNEQVVEVAVVQKEGSFNGLPVAGETGGPRSGVFGFEASGQIVKMSVVDGELAGVRVEGAHLDAAPEAAEGQPGVVRRVFDVIGIDGVEVVGRG